MWQKLLPGFLGFCARSLCLPAILMRGSPCFGSTLRGSRCLPRGLAAPVRAFEGEALDQADHQAEEHGAQGARQTDEDRAANHVEVSAAFEELLGVGGRGGRHGGFGAAFRGLLRARKLALLGAYAGLGPAAPW